ncbi:hypothetical protein [Pseudomonas aeruginosa]|uniref:hypothetical protein n=1 Tax=Pseudomonas aeruginosa TaxID=287 RepID=UPI000E3273E8|nr:hypothetical protein [Pseudomonas aeruginosa]MBG3901733.1 hypothetical protein [Pseudomonas aeruginosa]NQC04676.1 hypothetical protein [Pseudomonas aeruginosa]QTB74430.1 hypothetical protein LYSZa5_29705 [Pseudomonas aeruginosa]QTB86570.1 hypothetical protein LYSZa2_29705 [Pseudomonas aeruginosa]RTT87076.1 hypothetical protein DY963_19385 [Pseudomonas aeruginosa]
MINQFAETYWIKLYLSGPIEIAKNIIRQECLREGLCITIDPTTFIYTGGEETGYTVGIVNYPRFPTSPDDLEDRARQLMHLLLEGTYQHSALMMTPTATEWVSIRPQV